MIKYIQYIKEQKRLQKKLILFCLFFMVFAVFHVVDFGFANQMKRDPFIPLIDKDGNIRRGQDLFVEATEILPEITLKGILWDEKNPLAVINGRVLSEGSLVPLGKDKKILSKFTLKKINEDGVILEYNEKEFIIKLRKKEKE